MSTPLSKLCELIVDCPHSTAFDEGSGYPLIRTPNIGPGYFNLEGVHRVGKAAYDKRNLRAVPRPNDLILAREAPAGNVAIIPEGAQFCLGQRTVLIRPDSSKVYPLFLNYYLNAPEQRHKLLKNANGATVSHVNMPIIRNLSVDLPSYDQQKRIADVLSTYDSLIENSRKQIKLLEEAAQRLYKEWFIDLRFPGHETTTIDPGTGLPERWRVGKVKDVFTLVNGFAFKSSSFARQGEYEIVTIKNVLDGRFDTASMNSINDIPKNMPDECRLQQGDVLISLTGNVGRVCQIVGSNYLLNQRVSKIKTQSKGFVYCYLRSSVTKTKLQSLSTGTAQKNLSPIKTLQMEMVIPEDQLVQKFENFTGPVLNKMLILEKQIVCARKARDRLLFKLMSDEIEVF